MSSAGPQGLQAIPEELQDRESWLDPFDWYERMREEAPVRYDPERRTWDVFRYEDVKHVLDDDEMFSVDPQEAADFVEPEGPGEGLILDTMLFEDPPRHDELRGVVDEWFQPRTLADREPHFRDLAGELLDDAVDTHGQMDVVEDLAYPFPVTVIAELLGIPSSDRDQFKTWSNTLVEAASDEESADAFAERQQQIQMEMGQYFLEMIEDRRETPEDLLSVIVTAESDAGDDSPARRHSGCASCCSSRGTSRRRTSSRTRYDVSPRQTPICSTSCAGTTARSRALSRKCCGIGRRCRPWAGSPPKT